MMRTSIFLCATAYTLLWSTFALATTPTTDSSGGDQKDKASQRKEAMAATKKPKPKGGATAGTAPVHVTPTAMQGNPGFKIAENESPRPQDRVFFQYNYFDAVGPHVFLGANVSGDFQQTNFFVEPPFTVNGSGAMGGIFGGVLLALPNTNAFLGPRVGWEGGNINGRIVAPLASPLFTYTVTTNSMFYQEAMVKIPVPLLADPRSPLLSPGDSPALLFPFVTASVGVAEVNTAVKGTSGAFSVTDSAYRPGLTLTAGFGVPITRELAGFEKTFLGGTAEIFVQWRGTTATATVNIPGSVPQAYWINGIEFGAQLRY